jgi:hypothetical protein
VCSISSVGCGGVAVGPGSVRAPAHPTDPCADETRCPFVLPGCGALSRMAASARGAAADAAAIFSAPADRRALVVRTGKASARGEPGLLRRIVRKQMRGYRRCCRVRALFCSRVSLWLIYLCGVASIVQSSIHCRRLARQTVSGFVDAGRGAFFFPSTPAFVRLSGPLMRCHLVEPGNTGQIRPSVEP